MHNLQLIKTQPNTTYNTLYFKSILLFLAFENRSMTLSINVGSMINSFNIFFSMAKVHKFVNRSWFMVFLKNIFIRLNALLFLSLETFVTGMHNINCSNLVSSLYTSLKSAENE